MYLLFITLFFGAAYVYFTFLDTETLEPFSNTIAPNNNIDYTYDDFYTFLLDELFFDKSYYENFCKIIVSRIGNVYNKHLCIGIKHGGHINEILRKNADTISISNARTIVKLCKYNYPQNNYHFVDNYSIDPYIYNENTFTHISLIDCEIYRNQNLSTLLYNITRWLSNKGYLFIDVYDKIDSLKEGIKETNRENYIEKHHHYKNEIDNINHERFYLNETIKIGNTTKKNKHEFLYHDLRYLFNIAKEIGLKQISYLKHEDKKYSGRGIIVFQKQ